MFGLSKITMIVAAVVIAALLSAIGVQTWRLSAEKKAHEKTTAALVAEKVFSATLQVSVDKQNNAIEAMRTEDEARIAEAERLLALVAKQQAPLRAEIARLRAAEAAGSGACAPAMTIIRGGL